MTRIDRRGFLTVGAASGLAASGLLPAWARSQSGIAQQSGLSGTEFDLTIGRSPVSIDGRPGRGITINGTIPAPLLRWREGDDITLRVTNTLDADTSIHWHGILIPFHMDGVPGVSFPGIRPGETFTYRFPVRQAGTYWYHSHSGLQEQLGHYGPIVIDPAGSDPVAYDREYVIVLSDWTFMDPHRLFDELKKSADSLNYQKRTFADFLADVREEGLGDAIAQRDMWARMRMMRTDISDVTGATYTYLINGHGPQDNWTALFNRGERVRLRIINASAMSLLNFRIPGLAMTVVQADGLNVQPVETDEFQMGVAETYDVIVEPTEDRAYAIVAEAIDRSGMGVATLAPRLGMRAEAPPLRERPLLTMTDMGMGGHAGHDSAMAAGAGMAMDHGSNGNHAAMEHDGPALGTMNHDSMDHGAMVGGGAAMVEHNHPQWPGVANVAMAPISRLDEPGIGLEDVPHRTLSYSQLRSLDPNPDSRAPGREIELHLTSNMERYMWSFDGVRFSEVVEPIVFRQDERLRLTMVNDTMMPHPIHLHGMFFDVVNHEGDHLPRKHTIIVKPGERLSVDITANEVGDWAFHCHLLYHMHAGMMQVVSVRADAESHLNAHAHSGHHAHMTGRD